MATCISHSPAETAALGETWGREAERGLVIGLCGELGAGKTQLVKGLGRGLGIAEGVRSPTFALVNIYAGGRLPLFHLDLYRLETREQIIAAGLEEYLKPAGVTVIEWAERWLDVASPQATGHRPQATGHGLSETPTSSPCPSVSASSTLMYSAKPSGASAMRILALEFSSAQRSVAVVQAGGSAPHAPVASAEVVETGARSTNALGLVEDALRSAQLDRAQIECLAIGLGPGSYTGIRLAIALAQGWQLARSVRLLGVSSVDCLAAQAQADGIYGRVHVVIDAQRNEFYLASYDLSAETRREIEPLRLATLAEVRARVQAGGTLIGPEAANWFPDSRLIFPRAATLGRLAWGRTDFVPGEALEPIYLRPTQFVKAPPPRVLPR